MSFKMLRHITLSVACMMAGCKQIDLGFGDSLGDDTTDLDPTLQNLQEEVFTPFCADCHSSSGSASNLELRLDSEQNSYDTLVGDDREGVESEQNSLRLVDPGNPDISYIVWKVENNSNIEGDRMPLNGGRLSTGRINLLRDWISDGAPRFSGSSSNLAAKVSNADANLTASDTVTFSLHFSHPLDEYSLDSETILVSVKVDGEFQLLDDEYYRLAVLDSKNVEIDVETYAVLDDETAQPADIEAIRLVINDASIAAVMDQNGYLLDGDNDNEQGGAFVYVYEANNVGKTTH